jgi:hypothetical protein
MNQLDIDGMFKTYQKQNKTTSKAPKAAVLKKHTAVTKKPSNK